MRLSFTLLLALLTSMGYSQDTLKFVEVKIDPSPVVVEVGQSVSLQYKAFDADGNELKGGSYMFQMFGSPAVLRETGIVASSGAAVDTTGIIDGLIPGIYNSYLTRVGEEGEKFTMTQYNIHVINAPVGSISIKNIPAQLYTGSTLPLQVEVLDTRGFEIEANQVQITTTNDKVASVDALGNLRLHTPGKTSIKTTAGNIENIVDITVIENPVSTVELTVNNSEARTGDVLHFTYRTLDKKGKEVNIPAFLAVTGSQSEMGSGASATIKPDGRFVAEKPGIYTIIASTGGASAVLSVKINDRGVARDIEFVGQGSINKSHTSDFWIWEGVDGKDYAVTGTHSADGTAYFWDVTNPANIFMVDSIQVDARTVNDVKVSEDGKICVLSREGASDRKNGIVILDVSNPRDVTILSTFTENLTGGVHNLFIYENYVYALSNGQKYEIIDISDPKNPKGVSKFEIASAARNVHDVWIEDGIAYSSNWNDGIIMVDVGNGVAGGSPENPVEILRAKTQGNANHAAFPFTSNSSGKKYLIGGDEIFPSSLITSGMDLNQIIIPKGYMHFIDITDPKNPIEVARYEVPEAGSHNMWVEDDVLYIGYYNGGLRVVDISGELMGDLYKQGREIGHFLPFDKNGYIPNNAMTWGAQPHKGHVFFTDFNSGLWAAKVKPIKPDETKLETR